MYAIGSVVFTTRCLILSPLNNPPPPVCKRLPSHWPLVRQLIVVSPLLSRRRRLSSFQHVYTIKDLSVVVVGVVVGVGVYHK